MSTALLVLLAGSGARTAWLATSSAAVRERLGHGGLPRTGAVSWIRPPSWVERRARQAGVGPEIVGSVWPRVVLVGVAVLVASAVVFGLAGLLVAGAIVAAGPWLVVHRTMAVAEQRRARALPALLEDVARALRTGASLRQALRHGLDRADPSLRYELGRVCHAVDRGGTIDAALESWCERQPSEGLRLAVAALTLGIDVGGAPGRALDGVAASLRDRHAVERELLALSAQARASAVVMVAAPVVFAAFAAVADRRTGHFLVGTPGGLGCLTAGLALDAVAAWWMLRLTGGP